MGTVPAAFTLYTDKWVSFSLKRKKNLNNDNNDRIKLQPLLLDRAVEGENRRGGIASIYRTLSVKQGWRFRGEPVPRIRHRYMLIGIGGRESITLCLFQVKSCASICRVRPKIVTFESTGAPSDWRRRSWACRGARPCWSTTEAITSSSISGCFSRASRRTTSEKNSEWDETHDSSLFEWKNIINDRSYHKLFQLIYENELPRCVNLDYYTVCTPDIHKLIYQRIYTDQLESLVKETFEYKNMFFILSPIVSIFRFQE